MRPSAAGSSRSSASLPSTRSKSSHADRRNIVSSVIAEAAMLAVLLDHLEHLGRLAVLHRDELAHRCTEAGDRKSTRLNSSHSQISYAVFCLKKKKIKKTNIQSFKSPTIQISR